MLFYGTGCPEGNQFRIPWFSISIFFPARESKNIDFLKVTLLLNEKLHCITWLLHIAISWFFFSNIQNYNFFNQEKYMKKKKTLKHRAPILTFFFFSSVEKLIFLIVWNKLKNIYIYTVKYYSFYCWKFLIVEVDGLGNGNRFVNNGLEPFGLKMHPSIRIWLPQNLGISLRKFDLLYYVHYLDFGFHFF